MLYIEKYINKYANSGKLQEAINFFDMDNDGQINPAELENMLQTFARSEGTYMDDDQCKEIIKCGYTAKAGGMIQTKHLHQNINGTWQKIKK